MALAFPIPDHLPRAKPHGGDNLQATAILTAMSQTSPLTASDTSTWIKQLDTSIAETKAAIQGRIHQDLNAFERQLETSKSIQRRLLNLSSNVDQLQAELDGSEDSVLPNILKVLHHHSELAQRSLDADTATVSLRHLQACKHKYQQLSTLVKEGRLPEARSASRELQALVDSSPSPLARSRVYQELNSLLRATKDSIQEQLLQAYSACVFLSDSRFVVKHEYSQHLTLLSILDNITTESLLSTLAALRKEILARYATSALERKRRFELVSPLTLEVHNGHTHSPFHEISTLFTFIHDQLLPHVPESSRKSFASSFYVPMSEEIQTKILPASIPTTTTELSAFLRLIREAAEFERGAAQMGFFAGMEKRIETWGESAQSHYEKKRRSQLIEDVRTVILTDLAPPVTISTEVTKETTVPATQLEPPPSKVEPAPAPAPVPSEKSAQEEETNWGFDDEEAEAENTNGHPAEPNSNGDEKPKEMKEEKESGDDGWGFDEEDESMNQEPEPEPESKPEKRGSDPWGDEWDDAPMESPKPQSQSQAPVHAPNQTTKPAMTVVSVKIRENYLVSHAVTVVAQISTRAFNEGMALLNSRVFKDAGFASPHPTVLLSTAPSGFDLFRALYPMSRGPEFQSSLSAKLQYSNDCKFLADTARKLQTQYNTNVSVKSQEFESVATRFEEVADKLDVMSSSWFDESIEEETLNLLKIYSGSGNLRDLNYDAQFTDAQNSIKAIKDQIILLSKDLKGPLSTTVCYNTLGTIIDTVLDRIMQDVFSLRDISQIESERIAGLCLLLHPLDTIFPELENGISTVASYVPLWLKFTYLSDILEGTMADISAWLEAGHLVDYEAEELCRLVIALFAESPLRQSTISKIRATASA